MNQQQHLTRAKHLFYKGRHNQYVSKDLDRFQLIEQEETLKYEGITVYPYFDRETQQVCYGTFDTERRVLKLLMFSKSDYFFDEDATFEWAEYQPYGFEDQNDD